MLLSRFWYLFLAICAAGAVGAAMLAQGIINNRSDEQLDEALRRDRFELEAFLRLDARARIDQIAFITVDSKFGNLLRKAGGIEDPAGLRETAAEVKQMMNGHVKTIVDAATEAGKAKEQAEALRPDIAFSLDRTGRIIAQLGPLEANPPGAGLGTYPLVQRALQGYLRDDVWVYDRRVYRMAARPVVSGSQYAGAIVYGYRFSPAFAQELSASLGGATVGFYHGNDVFTFEAGELDGAPTQGELAAAIPGVLQDPDYLEKGRTAAIRLQGGGSASYARVAGSAAVADVGLLVARPRRVITSPQALFENATKEDVASLPQPLLAGAAVLAALLGMLFLFVERDKPFRALLAKTGAIADGSSDRLIITQWRGGFRKLADKINQAIDKEVEKAAEMSPRSKKKANLDELLGPTPDDGGDAFFGFAGDAPSASKPGPSPSQFAPAPGPAPLQPTPPVGAVAPVAAPPPPGPPAPPGPAVAAPAPRAPDARGNGWDEAAHFQATYEHYIATRRECGEPTETLTFEKFGVTLRKTRDQILSKHGGRSVKFTVYVKEGKAALKAAPVK